MKIIVILSIVLVLVLSGCTTEPETKQDKSKILWVDSYHAEYEWSQEIQEGIEITLKDDVELKIHRMDTKRNPENAAQAALDAKAVIESFNPDVVIVSDDNAFRYLVMGYYKDAELPFVYCGLNGDSSTYNAPYSNTAGMIEVAPISKLVKEMKKHAKGDKIGFLSVDTVTSRKEVEGYKKVLGTELIEEYSSSFAEWKQDFIDIQNKADMLIVFNNAGIEGWNDEEAKTFAEENTVIITGTVMDWMAPVSAITYDHLGEEQGEYAAKTALRILKGEKPSDIPEVQNKKSELILQMGIAKKLGITFSPELVKSADNVIEATC